jgi:hypothetical protein
MNELRAKAKELGINSFGMNKESLEAAIMEAEAAKNGGYIEPDIDNTEDAKEEQPVAPQAAPDQATMIAMMAAQLAKEANEKLSAMQIANPQKPSTPEAEINKRRESDRKAILKQEQVPITIHGGFIGAPKFIPSCVNGHVVKIELGKTKNIPLAHAENIARSLQMQQINLENMEKREQEALKALGV